MLVKVYLNCMPKTRILRVPQFVQHLRLLVLYLPDDVVGAPPRRHIWSPRRVLAVENYSPQYEALLLLGRQIDPFIFPPPATDSFPLLYQIAQPVLPAKINCIANFPKINLKSEFETHHQAISLPGTKLLHSIAATRGKAVNSELR